ncbi:MAG: hypothetical protein ACI9KE_005399, partial [Polyangiales bacterium]
PVAFRVTSDGALANSLDEAWDLPLGARVAVLHPANLDEAALAVWSATFADYEVMQPFEQLHRPTSRLTDDEANARELSRWKGKRVSARALLSLQDKDWAHGDVEDGGEVYDVSRTLGKVVVTLPFEPGIRLGDVGSAPEQTLGALQWREGSITAVAASELVRDLERLCEP